MLVCMVHNADAEANPRLILTTGVSPTPGTQTWTGWKNACSRKSPLAW